MSIVKKKTLLYPGPEAFAVIFRLLTRITAYGGDFKRIERSL